MSSPARSRRIFRFPRSCREFGRELDELAQRLSAVEPSAVCADGVPTRERLDAARAEHEHIRGRMIALQEELDWDVYRRYGLLDAAEAAELIADPASVPELKLGERAFEIVWRAGWLRARSRRSGSSGTGPTPITDIPAHWPEQYKAVVAKRIEAIENRPGYRADRAAGMQAAVAVRAVGGEGACCAHVLAAGPVRGPRLWFATDEWGREQPRPMTVNRLADRLRADADVVSVARLLDGPDADLADVLTRIIADQHVPYLAQLRYTATGMRKRAQWEETWDKQREEDANRRPARYRRAAEVQEG